MPIKTTIGQLVVNHALPEGLRDYSRVLNGKGIEALLRKVAEQHPDKYRDVVQALSRVGYHTAQLTGGFSFGPEHMRPAVAARKYHLDTKKKMAEIYADKTKTDDEKEKALVDYLIDTGDKLTDDIMKESLSEGNPLALQVLSGARGKPMNLRSLRGGDILYVDHHDRPIPIPITRSYPQGLTPAQYYAGTFGARKGVADTKFSVQRAGFMCLAANTLVRMADGSVRSIEEVVVGEQVLGSDCNGKTFPVRVLNRFDNGNRICGVYTFRGAAHELVCTSDHRVLSAPGEVKRIQECGRVLLRSGESVGLAVARTIRDLPTYDIEVDHPDHLFVLANGMIVSNSKQLNQISHRLVVSALDYDGDGVPDDAPLGMPVKSDDPDNEGALLAQDLAGYKRNTVLTPKILADIREQGFERMLVRSPIVGGHPNGGLYARDLGVRERGGLSPNGDYVGIAAAQALSEPLTQSQLSSKHSGGVAGASKGVTGFALINQLVQVPSIFKGGAAHAQEDGRVSAIRPAPQGGTYIVAGGKDHYVGHGFDPKVKVGDVVEAGDVLSEGIPNPAEIVKHKGAGEGKRYLVEAYMKACKDSGMNVHRRNVEILARGLIDHVEMDDELDEHLPGDIVSYQQLEHKWRPRDGHEVVPVAKGAGRYLEKPVLHYSIGTKLRPSVLKNLNDYGVKNISVHNDPPPFRPVMIRGMENLAHDRDWMTRFLGSYLKKNFLKGVHRGDVSDEAGSSYVPSLSRTADFGKTPPLKGWTPTGPLPTPPVPAQSLVDEAHSISHHEVTPSPTPDGSIFKKLSSAALLGEKPNISGRSHMLDRLAIEVHTDSVFKKMSEAEDTRPYRERAELFAMRDGKVYGGLYPDTGSFGVFGGGIDPGETPEQAALREFQEESGLTATNARLIPIPPLDHEWKPPYDSVKHALRAKTHRGSRTHYVMADLGDFSMRGQAEEQRKNERLYDLNEAIALASNVTGSLAAPNAKRKQVLEHLLAMQQAQTVKKASSVVLESFKCEHPAGTTVRLVDREDDEDEDYPLTSITYPVDYGTLPGHTAEDGEDLNAAVGNSGDLHGKFTVRLPGSFKKETKFYSGLDEQDKDQLLRAYASVLVSHDELDNDSLAQEVAKFRTK